MSDQDQGQTRRMPVRDPGEADTPAPIDEPPSAALTTAEAAPPDPPPATRDRDTDHGRTASILFGLVILGFGLWFFAEYTLGYDLPNIRWSQLWPVLLIVIGLWVVLGSMRRGSR